MSEVDVIIPCRNAPEALALTLHYFWANAYDPRVVASVVFVDNCSTDRRVLDLLYHAAARYPDTHRVVLNERNVGVWCSVNRGLALGRAEFAFVLTSDVLLCQNALKALFATMLLDSSLGNLGPTVLTGLGRCPELSTATLGDEEVKVDRTTYNGAAWMLRRSLLKTLGWYDPRFYVAFGDTDYAERMRLHGIGYGVLQGVPCVHLDKQSRRADGTAVVDTETELKDAREFARKWADRPDVVRRHTPADAAQVIAWKEHDLGGWDKARVQ
jgi:GT2 family glycosyltransferase